MTDRTKWLALGALLVFGLYFGDSSYRSWIEQPKEQLEARYDSLLKEIRNAKDTQRIAEKKAKRMDEFAQRGLPFDPILARSKYQQWLLALVDKHAMESPSIDAAQPSVIQIKSRTKRRQKNILGHRISFTLRTRSTLAKITDFLYEFRQAGHLHKIASLSLNPLNSGGKVDFVANIEALSLQKSESKENLSNWVVLPEESTPRDSYDKFVRRNLFARGFAKALFDIELKAITRDRRGELEAWFKLGALKQTVQLAAGSQVPVPLHDIAVVDVQNDQVMIRLNGEAKWIHLGQSVGEVYSDEEASPRI